MDTSIVNDDVMNIKVSGEMLETQIVQQIAKHVKHIFVGTDFTQLKLNSGFLELVLKKVFTVLLNKNMKDVSTTKILSLLEQILRLVIPIRDADIKSIRSNAQYILENELVEGLLSKPKKWKDRAKKLLKGKALKKR
jgi:hypothetical protein